jgi:hypothetical protein
MRVVVVLPFVPVIMAMGMFGTNILLTGRDHRIRRCLNEGFGLVDMSGMGG